VCGGNLSHESEASLSETYMMTDNETWRETERQRRLIFVDGNAEGDLAICRDWNDEGNTIWRVIYHIGEAWFVDSRVFFLTIWFKRFGKGI
jgi:hypothetical protein